MKIKALKNYLTLRFLACLLPLLSLANTTAKAADENSSIDPSNLTVLITGANRGLGLEWATQLQAKGYHVIGTARSPERATELKATGAEVLKLDVTSEEDIAALAKALEGRTIDILLNNAGYVGAKEGTDGKKPTINNLSREDILNCLNVNTLGPLFVTQALLPNLKLSSAPRIINISTRAGALEKGPSNLWSYSVSKTALNMVTVNTHGNLHPQGFIVIALAPGHNNTDMGGESAKFEPKDSVAKMIPFVESLTSEHSGKFWFNDGSPMAW